MHYVCSHRRAEYLKVMCSYIAMNKIDALWPHHHWGKQTCYQQYNVYKC